MSFHTIEHIRALNSVIIYVLRYLLRFDKEYTKSTVFIIFIDHFSNVNWGIKLIVHLYKLQNTDMTIDINS